MQMPILQEELEALVEQYKGRGLLLVGCWHRGQASPACPADLLLLQEGSLPSVYSIRLGSSKARLCLIPIDMLFKPPSLEAAWLLSNSTILIDKGWELGEALRSLKSKVEPKAIAKEHLLDSASMTTYAYASLEYGDELCSSLWLQSSALLACSSKIALSGSTLGPSHMLEQLRYATEGDPGLLSLCSDCLQLNEASSITISRRVKPLRTLALKLKSLSNSLERLRIHELEDLASRASFLTNAHRPADCYAYLAHQLLTALRLLYSGMCAQRGIPPLPQRMLSELSNWAGLDRSMLKAARLGMGRGELEPRLERLHAYLHRLL